MENTCIKVATNFFPNVIISSVLNRLIGGSDFKIIYRHYATLYFVFCVDSSESELGILDLIQVFVETLDKCFENVCELDLIFHVDKVHYILSEMVMGGMVLETNMTEILTRVNEQDKIEKEEVPQLYYYFYSLFFCSFHCILTFSFNFPYFLFFKKKNKNKTNILL
ncbi:DgyrCDS2646 [Dimorphilus gyrociliatus]|uniref:DgyrCDS2646 n=1 Tax=Dimorphilus gyrociliatus TaxID=2664684 RepID=A0A7I8VDP7_9ANNE|nr:DgyrCDS2646 [Dimorphilus gyrociliatus]